MPIHIENCVFENMETVVKSPYDISVSIIETRMNGVGTVFEIISVRSNMAVPLNAPNGATRDELVALMDTAKTAITDGRDPVEAISQTPTWESWASRGANLVTIALPIVEFVKTLF